MMQTKILAVKDKDVLQLSALAMRVYLENYHDFWHDSGVWYANKSFKAEQLRKELLDENNRYFMVFMENTALGFLKVCLNHPLPNVAGKGMELERIYLSKAAQGKGIGKKLIKFVMEMAWKLEKDYVWLRTMDSSEAKTFYEKQGFQVLGVQRLDFEQMKEERRGMLVMKKSRNEP